MKRSRRGRARCSARNMATRCASSPWAEAAATPWAGRWSSAAAPTSSARAISVSSPRSATARSLPARAVEGIDLKDLRSLADEGKKRLGSGVVAIVGVTEEGRAGVVVGVTDDLTSRFSAIDLVRKGAEVLGGKGGGGRADMAQAGGPDGSKAEAALKAIEGALGGS